MPKRKRDETSTFIGYHVLPFLLDNYRTSFVFFRMIGISAKVIKRILTRFLYTLSPQCTILWFLRTRTDTFDCFQEALRCKSLAMIEYIRQQTHFKISDYQEINTVLRLGTMSASTKIMDHLKHMGLTAKDIANNFSQCLFLAAWKGDLDMLIYLHEVWQVEEEQFKRYNVVFDIAMSRNYQHIIQWFQTQFP